MSAINNNISGEINLIGFTTISRLLCYILGGDGLQHNKVEKSLTLSLSKYTSTVMSKPLNGTLAVIFDFDATALPRVCV